MGEIKQSKNIKCSCFRWMNILPLITLFTLHFFGFMNMKYSWHLTSILVALFTTIFTLLLGQSFAAITFLLSGFLQYWPLHLATAILCFVSAIATFFLSLLLSIEFSYPNWMYYGTFLLDGIIFIGSIIELLIITSKSKKNLS